MTFLEPCRWMRPTRTPDGYGGHTLTWTEGETLSAAVGDVHETLVTFGGGRAVKQQATVYLSREAAFAPGDVIRREGDGTLFRLLGYGVDAPGEGELPLQKVPAERMMT